jgi:hypothetical protein
MCPKGGKTPHRARRVFIQVLSPKPDGGTGRATSIPLPYVYCGTTRLVKTEGRLVGELAPLAKGEHGLVALDVASFNAQRRQSVRLTSRRFPEWRSKGRPISKGKQTKLSPTPKKTPKKIAKKASRSHATAPKPSEAPADAAPRKARSARSVGPPRPLLEDKEGEAVAHEIAHAPDADPISPTTEPPAEASAP